MKIEKMVKLWESEGVIDDAVAGRILAFETGRKSGFDFGDMLIRMAGLAIFLGLASIIGANWKIIPPFAKIAMHAAVNGGVAFALYRFVKLGRERTVWMDFLIVMLAALTMTFIALIGQIYQTQEEVWKVGLFWLALTTPFWLGLGAGGRAGRLWILAAVAVYFLYVFSPSLNVFSSTRHLRVPLPHMLGMVLVPYALVAAGQISVFRARSEAAFREFSYAGYLAIALGVSLLQFFWYVKNLRYFEPQNLADTAGFIWTARYSALAAVMAAAGILGARKFRLLVPQSLASDAFLLLSVGFGAMPVLIPHEAMNIWGAVFQIAYWSLCGWAASRQGYAKALQIASTFIALRLIGIYIEVFGSLLQTGFGLLVSGLLLIVFVYGARRIIAVLGEKR
ncbi:MAG: DUF2157 domain-containing protein [Alphaproteobacteria bacterium]|nr:DUF2157 domain-containing protein [Alphaproteobacteria bacterium]